MRVQFTVDKRKNKFSLFRLFSLRPLINGPLPDRGLMLAVFGLLVFGWVMVYSSSALFAETRYHDQYFFLKRQLLWSFIGLFFFVMAMNIPSHFWQTHAKTIYFITLALLVAVLITGPEIAGAKRWIRLKGFGFQPSELGKLALVFVVSDYMDRRQSRLKDFKRGLVPLLGLCGVLMGLILIEPDLGTPLLMGAVLISLLILGGARWRHFFLIGILAFPVLLLAVVKETYRLKRLLVYLNPWSDPQGAGYQLVQSLLALGSGGILGQGLGSSKIKVSNMPDAHTDFIFSILGEELGLLGTLGCAFLFFFICLRGLQAAARAETCFSRLTAAGISLLIGYQALINMGVACGLFPTKGMTLPFISFGGSSLVVTLFSVGILVGLSAYSRRSASQKNRPAKSAASSAR